MEGESLVEDELELLKFAFENGILDKDAVSKMMKMKERERLLRLNPYQPYQDNQGKWCVYLPDSKSKTKRKLKRRSTREEIEEIVISFWREMDENPTLEELFHEWLGNKLRREEISRQTGDRYRRQFDQCFDEFGQKRVKSLTEYEIECFVRDTIHDKSLTAKGYANFRTLCYGIFHLAKQKKYIEYNVFYLFKEMAISQKAFRHEIKDEEDEVFTEKETPLITKWLEEHADLKNLGLLLTFKSGVRIGELAALKKCDLRNNVIHVCRTEIRYEDEKNPKIGIYEVRDRPKTDAGIRDVVLPDTAIPIIEKIMALSSKGDWLFESRGERLKTYQFRARLRRVCEKVGIKPKSPHKIRKEYATQLLDNGVPESVILGQMGHTDILTTKNHYYKNRKSEAQKKAIINGIKDL